MRRISRTRLGLAALAAVVAAVGVTAATELASGGGHKIGTEINVWGA
jgi:hypothetical protein